MFKIEQHILIYFSMISGKCQKLTKIWQTEKKWNNMVERLDICKSGRRHRSEA